MPLTIIERIKTDRDSARRNRAPSHSEYDAGLAEVSYLNLVIGEIEKVGKNDGNRETTDAEAIDVLKRLRKNGVDMLAEVRKKGFEPPGDTRKMVEREDAILSRYLPKQMTDEEVEAAVQEIIASGTPKQMGPVMGQLKTKFAGLYDGKAASEIVKRVVAQ